MRVTAPRVKREPAAKKRFGIYYYKIVSGNLERKDTSGSTNDYERALGHASSHCSRSEINPDEYAMALIIDRHLGCMLRSYTRRGTYIDIKIYKEIKWTPKPKHK